MRLTEHLREGGDPHGLVQIFIHARIEITLLICGQDIGGEGEDIGGWAVGVVLQRATRAVPK